MIIPEKIEAVRPSTGAQGLYIQHAKATAADAQSVMSQEPPPYSEAGPSLLSSSPPVGRHVGGHSPQHSWQGQFERPHGHAQVREHVPRPSGSQPLPPLPHDDSQMLPTPNPHHRPNSLPATLSPPSPGEDPWLPSPDLGASPRPDVERRCNFLAERKNVGGSLKGTWNLDTGLQIPESLRPSLADFHGYWNEMDKKSVKARERERKKRGGGGGWGRKKVVVDPLPPPKLANEGVRPNLMLSSKDASVQAEVNVSSSDGAMRMATIVAESNDGSVKLQVNAPTGQPLRIFAISMDGSVRVRIPSTFEGAVWMTTEDGTAHISEGVKSRLMSFSLTNKTVRGYIGDWQSTNFGNTAPSSSEESEDPFKAWTGPLVHIFSKDGSVHLAYVGEDTSSAFSKAMRSIYNGLKGSANGTDEGDADASRRLPREQVTSYPLEQVRQDPRVSWISNTTAGARAPLRGYTQRLSMAPAHEDRSLFHETPRQDQNTFDRQGRGGP